MVGGVVSTLNRTIREGLIKKMTSGPRLEEKEIDSYINKYCSIPGRGNGKCKDPGPVLFLEYWKKSVAEAATMRK